MGVSVVAVAMMAMVSVCVVMSPQSGAGWCRYCGHFSHIRRGVTEPLVFREGGRRCKRSRALVAARLGSAVRVHTFVTAEIGELCVALHADLNI